MKDTRVTSNRLDDAIRKGLHMTIKDILKQDRESLQQRKRLLTIAIGALFLLTVAVSIVLLVLSLQPGPDTLPPVFSGVKDIEIVAGESVAFRAGVSAYDEKDGALEFTVDTEQVDIHTPGSYTVVYRAVDAAGNVAEKSATLTVKIKVTVDEDVLFALVDEKIEQWGLRSGTRESICETLYWKIKSVMQYTSDSQKDDWMGEAYRALTEGEGDCFTYYALVRAFFERLDFSYMTIERTKGAKDTTHYWMIVNVGNETVPAWYHYDVCPRPKEIPHNLPILMRDEDLASYNENNEGYYSFDAEQYPETP